jgi:hypothetical protein
MKIKRAVRLLPFFATVYLFAFSAPPVYPGAKPIDLLNQSAKAAGQDTMAYNTPDSFEKVYEFYKTKGTEVQRAHRVSPKSKFALIKDEAGYGIAISWKEDSKADGTVIHIGKGAAGR